ncbi:hypothetical protein BU15DRAFT_86164 [Melanogaster broomeanus]|nr:hypothetical protein BU15DRAFT_86164 [Melanogaster broomeanus]
MFTSLYHQVFSRAPIYDLIFASLSPRSLVRIALTFKTSTLISGSNALQFLDRTFYPESDLDIYTHPGHAFEVANFLVESEGYHFVPRDDQDQDWKEEIKDNWDGTLKPYSLYPLATFEDRKSLGMPNSRSFLENAMQKYVRRGWRIYFMPTPHDLANPTKPPFMLDETRWTGVKERPSLSPASAPLPWDPAVYNGWRLKPPDGPPVQRQKGYECSYSPLQATIFRYNYMIPDEELFNRLRSWVTEQGRHCHVQFSTKYEWVW